MKQLAKQPGNYVPSFYDAEYDEAGNFKALVPTEPEAKAEIENASFPTWNTSFPTKPIVPNIDIVHNRAVLELSYGRSRGCRFCQAGMLYRPIREKTPEQLVKLAKDIVANSGYDEISLMSLSSADYSCLPELVDQLLDAFKGQKVSVSLPAAPRRQLFRRHRQEGPAGPVRAA